MLSLSVESNLVIACEWFCWVIVSSSCIVVVRCCYLNCVDHYRKRHTSLRLLIAIHVRISTVRSEWTEVKFDRILFLVSD